MKPFLFLLLSGLASAQPIALDAFFRSPPSTFTPAVLDSAKKKLQLQWVDQGKMEARLADAPYTLFGDLEIAETLISTSPQGMSKGIFLIYSRGDRGSISEGDFDMLVKKSMAALDKALGVKSSDKTRNRTGVVATEDYTWKTPALACTLETSADSKAEFIRIVITPPTASRSLSEDMASNNTNVKADIKKQVLKTPDGDVFVDGVPMVDQGAKGYCVVASAERIFRFYGIPVDQHELAQIANSSAAEGTSPDLMIAKLKPMQNRLRFVIRDLIDFEGKDILKLIEDYNRLAKKKDAREIPDPRITGEFSMDGVNADLLKTVRLKSATFKRFERYIEDYTGKGVPLMWSLSLGIIPEKGIPQNAGGHLRLIIGYNLKTKEVLYSDSWGAGHELKRMPMEDAWTVTHGLYLMEPLSR